MIQFSVSMMCANPFKLESQIKVLDKKTDFYHIDIMDGHFVPNLTLSLDYVKNLVEVCSKPVDIHLMVDNPNDYLDELISYSVNCISFHIETAQQSAFRIIRKIKDAGIKVGIVISPRFSIDDYRIFLPMIDKVIVMTVEPGFAGQKMIEEVIPKIEYLNELRSRNGYSYNIEVDGSNNYSTFLRYKKAGVDISILGTGLFNALNISSEFDKIKAFVNESELPLQYILGIDVGGTHIRYGLVNENNEIISASKIRTINDERKFAEWLSNVIKEEFKEFSIKSISVGLPGIVNPNENRIISLPNLNGFTNSNFFNELQNELGIKVNINKDTIHLLAHDISRFNLNNQNALGFYLGTGFGSSLYLDSKFFIGDTFSSGEIGHLNVFDKDNQCGCGNFGCTETQVSGWYLNQIRSEYFPETMIDDVFRIHQDHPMIIKYMFDLAKVISIAVNLLDVKNVILGGGVVNSPYFPLETLIQNLRPMLRSDDMRNIINIIKSDSSNHDGILGAAKYAREFKG